MTKTERTNAVTAAPAVGSLWRQTGDLQFCSSTMRIDHVGPRVTKATLFLTHAGKTTDSRHSVPTAGMVADIAKGLWAPVEVSL